MEGAITSAVTALKCRPTSRCLVDLYEGKIPEAAKETDLAELSHQLIRKAAEVSSSLDFDGTSGTVSATSPRLLKVRAGQWRGAIWRDPGSGQDWLVAAGLRRAGDESDVYGDFTAPDGESVDVSYLLPTDDDERRLGKDRRNCVVATWEQSIVAGLLSAIADCVSTVQPEAMVVSQLDGVGKLCEIEVALEEFGEDEEGAGTSLLLLDLNLDAWHVSDQFDAMVGIICEVIDDDTSAWDVLPGADGSRSLTVLIEAARLDAIAHLATAPSADGAPRPTGQMELAKVAHYTKADAITGAMVEGEGLRGLCGQWFVPTRLTDGIPTCLGCQLVQRVGAYNV